MNYSGHASSGSKFGTEKVVAKLKKFRGVYCPINNKAKIKMNKISFVNACRRHVEKNNSAVSKGRTSELDSSGFATTNNNACSRCEMSVNIQKYNAQSQKKGVKPVQLKITLPDGITLFTEKELKAFNTKR